MTTVFYVIFWLSVLSLLYSYALYPLLLGILASFKKKKDIDRGILSDRELPTVAVILSVYNEESVIEAKIRSVFASNYPKTKLEMLIGSDGCTDKTESIIRTFIEKGFPISLIRYEGRNGKSSILNRLVSNTEAKILVLTDANIIFSKEALRRLALHFEDQETGLVGANIVNKGLRKDGISYQESAYIKRENLIKYREGLIWGTMMGAFGACYAIRRENFHEIPPNFLMEDFYITMKILAGGHRSLHELEAVCYEDVSNKISEEFKRKVRISAGNFQNLSTFYPLLWPPFTGLSISFFSHKILRWLGPFFLLSSWIASLLLSGEYNFYFWMFILQTAGLLSPVIDHLLKLGGANFSVLRFIHYFYAMNFALLLGFVKFVKGIETNAWQPTQRNQ